MKNKKVVVSVALASMLVSSLGTVSMAANRDIYDNTTKEVHEYKSYISNDEKFMELIDKLNENGLNFTYEYNGKGYTFGELDENFKAAEGNLEEALNKTTEVDVPSVSDELKVETISAINKTEITVKLSKPATEILTKDFFKIEGATVTSVAQGLTPDLYVLTVASLDGKKGTVTINGISKAYDYTTPAVDKATVESVTFDNYRQFKVTYSTKVDEVSAIDPVNYYFEIVEGNAGKLGAAVGLGSSNQLSSLKAGWFDKIKDAAGKDTDKRNNIFAEVVDGKTVVTINLPENGRFTTEVDTDKTITAKIADKTADGNPTGTVKSLIKDTTVYVAVRNVKDIDGKRTIDTAVKSMFINDAKTPAFVKASRDTVADGKVVKEVFETGATKTVELKEDTQKSVFLQYDEPVAKMNGDTKVYVNGIVVPDAIGEDGGLKVLNFKSEDATKYADAKVATLDLKAAINATMGADSWKADSTKVYNVKVVGVRDLANNLQSGSNTVEFNVKVVAPTTAEDTKIKPEVKDIVQMADNVLRIEWNRPEATGKLTVVTTDGSVKEIKEAQIPLSETVAVEGVNHHYSYMAVAAKDAEATENEGLGYNKQNFIVRTLKVSDMVAFDEGNEGSDDQSVDATGTKPYEKIGMKLYKDIQAPVLDGDGYLVNVDDYDVKLDDYAHIKDETTATKVDQLVFNMEDVTPFSPSVENTVIPMGYDSGAADIDASHIQNIKVSYEKNGITVTDEIGFDTDIATGDAGVKVEGNVVTVNLTSDLLNKDSKLVEGATYHVEVPKGYFADAGKDVAAIAAADAKDGKVLPKDVKVRPVVVNGDGTYKLDETELTALDIKYVDDSRQTDYGYTSLAFDLSITVPGEQQGQESDLVPQTSKELISTIDGVNGQEVHVQFKGSIDVDTLKNPANYILNGTSLEDLGYTSNDIKFVADNVDQDKASKKEAVFLVPKNTVKVDGDVAFKVVDVANKLGAKMTQVETTVFLEDNTAPTVIAQSVEGSNTILVTFDEQIGYKGDATDEAVAGNFTATINGVAVEVTEVTKGTPATTLKVKLATAFKAGDTVVITTKKDVNGDMLLQDISKAKNPVNVGTEVIVNP